MALFSLLDDRGVLAVTGDDARDFLQGLVTRDMRKVVPGSAVFAALLSPQGRFLFDFFIIGREDGFWLETDKARLPDLIKRLTMYRLRAKVEFRELPLRVMALWNSAHRPEGQETQGDAAVIYADPRLSELGWRVIFDPASPALRVMPSGAATEDNIRDDYEAHRLSFGVPEGAKDLTYDRSILLEYGYDELGAVDFDKGCYVGQEVTARSKHRASLRKFIHLLRSQQPLPSKGTPVLAGGREAGVVTSSHGNQGLAHLNHEEILRAAREKQPLMAGEVAIAAALPAWCRTELAARES